MTTAYNPAVIIIIYGTSDRDVNSNIIRAGSFYDERTIMKIELRWLIRLMKTITLADHILL